MTSTFGWLAYDDAERRRMAEVINLFREKGTLDELGIGTIRDTFADHFFPGTSTIQTRARYFFFIPWIYQLIEAERVPSARAGRRARELQATLVGSLAKGGVGASSGLIGIEAGETLQRLPSSIYWQGLRRWGIRLFDGSVERYHASLDAHYRDERAARHADGGELLQSASRNWLGSIPDPPDDLLSQTTFDLTASESDFLSERLRRSAPDSLLAACVAGKTTGRAAAKAPWEMGIGRLEESLCTDIEYARLFSLVMEGAALLYNLMLSEELAGQTAAADSTLVDRYRKALDVWAAQMVGDQDALAAWGQSPFWSRMRLLNPRLSSPACRFAATWIDLAVAGPRGMKDDESARRLLRARERQTKGGLARLHNPRALERWSGASGLGRLTYRWTDANTIVTDIAKGSRRQLDVADA